MVNYKKNLDISLIKLSIFCLFLFNIAQCFLPFSALKKSKVYKNKISLDTIFIFDVNKFSYSTITGCTAAAIFQNLIVANGFYVRNHDIKKTFSI